MREQFDPTKRHLPFVGEGVCDEPQHDAATGYTSVHCLGPRQPLAPGEVFHLPFIREKKENVSESWLGKGKCVFELVMHTSVHGLGLRQPLALERSACLIGTISANRCWVTTIGMS